MESIWDSVDYSSAHILTLDGLDETVKVIKVVDGDTYWLAAHLHEPLKGLPGIMKFKVRLARCNAPELGTVEGDSFKEEMTTRLHHQMVRAVIGKNDKYGRPLATLYYKDRCINDEIISRFGTYMLIDQP